MAYRVELVLGFSLSLGLYVGPDLVISRVLQGFGSSSCCLVA